MFFELIRKNSRSNRKENGIFFLSLIISIVAFYIILSLGEQDVMRFLRTMESQAVNRLLQLIPLLYAFSLFIIFFLIYFTSKYQIERRSHEFGMYLMMGMRRGRLTGMLILEDLWNSLLALVIGVPTAIFLSELISLITARLVGLGIIGHRFTFSLQALVATVIGFLAIKLVAFCLLSGKMARKEIGRMLADAEEDPVELTIRKSSRIQFVLGVILLVIAYTLAIQQASWARIGILALSVLLGVCGTVMLFFGMCSGLQMLLRKGGKKEQLRTFTFRQLQENIVRRPLSLAVTSLLVLAALCCFGYGVSEGMSSRSQETHVMDYTFTESTDIQAQLSDSEVAANIGEVFPIYINSFYPEEKNQELNWEALLDRIREQKPSEGQKNLLNNMEQQMSSIYLIGLSGYNQILKASGKPELNLSDNQAAFYCGPEFFYAEPVNVLQKVLESQPEIMLGGNAYQLLPEVTTGQVVVDRAITLSYALVVSDDVYKSLIGEHSSVYWNAILNEEFVKEHGLMQAISSVNEVLDAKGIVYESYLQNMGRQLFYTVAASYTTLYLAIIFLIIANTVLAVQFLMQQQKTGKRYQVLARLGSSYQMICKSARKQIQWYFGLPVGIAALSSIFGTRALLSGMIPADARGQIPILFMMALAMILVLCVVECIYMMAVMKLSDRHILELMRISRED